MHIYYKNTKINYKIAGDGKHDIVFLHGWGGNINSFSSIGSKLEKNSRLLFIDFPPFGESSEPFEPFDMDDYCNICIEIFKIYNFNKPILIGHSFGGRVGIMLASRGFASKLVLVDSAGIKPKFSLKKCIKKNFYKIAKRFGIKLNLGSEDYQKLSPKMKKTFVNIVNTFLEKYAITITIPTLIYWGENDKETPIYMARKLNKLIKNSELVVLKNAGHFSYLDDVTSFVKTINSFIFE